MALDKLTPLSAPPGTGLTDEPGKWRWERPPIYTNPDDAIDYIEEKISEEETNESMMKMLIAGITVEELVNQVSFKGFMAGFYNPDVAELIKPAVAILIYDMALDQGIDPKMFIDEEEDEDNTLSDVGMFNVMKQRNPQLFRDMNEYLNEEVRMQEQQVRQADTAPKQPESQPSFLDTQDV